MEALLHYVWKHRLFDTQTLTTISGEKVEVVDVGYPNIYGGADFTNAKIRIDGTLWAGNVEIHNVASDWLRHNHQEDRSYDSVILHVVERSDRIIQTTDGRIIPQIEIQCPPGLRNDFGSILSQYDDLACGKHLAQITPIQWQSWKERLLMERLEQKSEAVLSQLQSTQGHWQEVFYRSIARAFGFGINGDPFEQTAISLPLNIILKENGVAHHTEALLFGQAGFLNDESIEDEYYHHLASEYRFLQNKYGLRSIDISLWNFGRVRNANFPTLRLAQFARLISSNDHLFSTIQETETIHDIEQLFRISAPEYWDQHYLFGETADRKSPKILGRISIESLIINAVVPTLFAKSKEINDENLAQRAISMLEELPTEQNYIIRKWQSVGISAEHAADSQALIQLHKVYCLLRKCPFCMIGHRLMSRVVESYIEKYGTK